MTHLAVVRANLAVVTVRLLVGLAGRAAEAAAALGADAGNVADLDVLDLVADTYDPAGLDIVQVGSICPRGASAAYSLSDDLVADDDRVFDLSPAGAGGVQVRCANAAVLDLDVDISLLPGLAMAREARYPSAWGSTGGDAAA